MIMVHSSSLLNLDSISYAGEQRKIHDSVDYFGRRSTSISDMSITNIITVIGVVIALFAVIVTLVLYNLDKRQQWADQARADLQAIIGVCGRFLHALSGDVPYPIFHTATTITKEFCSHLSESPTGKDVLALLQDEDLLFAICVEGWLSSNQVMHLMDLVEELERIASSHYLRGKLLLTSQASFLLTSILAKVCSPKSFFSILRQLTPESCRDDDVKVFLDETTIELQNSICKTFKDNYKDTIDLCLHFIQIVSSTFLVLPELQLVNLAKAREFHHPYSIVVPAADSDKLEANEMIQHLNSAIEQETSLLNRIQWVKIVLKDLEYGINGEEYMKLVNLIDYISFAVKTLPSNVAEG